MTFPDSFFSFSDKSLSSATPTSDIKSTPVGAGSTQDLNDHYFYHDKFIKWIHDTKKKIPRGNTKLRKEAFLADPLLKGTIFPYLKNTLLKGGDIETADNKLYSEAITEIEDYLEQIKLMQTFRDSFLDLNILVGHTYFRADPDKEGNISHLEQLEPSSMVTYNDPWDSSIVAYHQKAMVSNSWSTMGTCDQVDSWFIPFLNNQVPMQIEDIYATHILNRGVGNDLKVLDLFEIYKLKYNISDVTNLRIASSERIIAMHHAINFKTADYDYDHDNYDNSSYAPIDSVLLAIFLKRLLIVNSPNVVFAVLSPFIHAVMGILKESKDAQGNPVIVSSLPSPPVASDPEYAVKLQRYNDFVDAFKKLSDNVVKSFREGGVITTGPDTALKPIESARNVTHQFIKGLTDQLDDEICYNFGLPKALIAAKGSELATSRTIAATYNSMHEGERLDYEAVANKLIKQQFEGMSWTTKTKEGDKEVTVNYKFEDIKAHFVLKTLDTKNLLEEAQTFKTKTEGLVNVKNMGASKEDMQALCEEADLGLLGLDNFAAPVSQEEDVPAGDGAAQAKAILPFLKACLQQGLFSSGPTDPSGFEDEKIKKLLEETYKTAKEDIDHLFEEE